MISNDTDANDTALLHSGLSFPDPSEPLCTVWAVYDRALLEAEMPGVTLASGDDDLAETVSGWYAAYRGAGQSFADPPRIRVSRTRVLVTQRRGRDV